MKMVIRFRLFIFLFGILSLISCAKEKGLVKEFYHGSFQVLFPDTTISFDHHNSLSIQYDDISENALINVRGEQYDSTSANFFELRVQKRTCFKSEYTYSIDMNDLENHQTGGLVEKMTHSGSYTLKSGSISFDELTENRIKGLIIGYFVNQDHSYAMVCIFDFTS